jgi:hypothetical protein
VREGSEPAPTLELTRKIAKPMLTSSTTTEAIANPIHPSAGRLTPRATVMPSTVAR